MARNLAAGIFGFAVAAIAAQPGWAAGVKVTPLGTHDGEFCRVDRALLFEDPDGTTILYDVGRTVLGPSDSRLDEVDVVLASSVHGDHLGDQVPEELNAGTCASPETPVSTTPNSNTAEIAAGKGARIFAGGEMSDFLQKKVATAGGEADQVDVLRFGGKRTAGGVTVAVIPTVHSNGVSPAFLEEPLDASLEANGLTAYVGPDNGFVLTFSNSLVVYLSADTGLTADMETVVQRYYGPQLAIVNIGDIYTMGPEEAAWAVNELIRPNAVIPSHANEAATEGGEVRPDTKTARFMDLVQGIPVHLPLSGQTMEFDADGQCVSGCPSR